MRMFLFFFFSSRRRHTIWPRDWSSDVCSSDLIPLTMSSTSIAYNLPGMPSHLKITGTVLANIYLGKIKKWNDAALKGLNPGVNLPDTDITPIWRSDGSGTTYNFTDYLQKVSPEWRSKVGRSTQVNFPEGVGGRGSSGKFTCVLRPTFDLHSGLTFCR